VLSAQSQLADAEAAAEKVLARYGHTQPHDAAEPGGQLPARPLLALQVQP
jgi:hypothetical protein